MLEGSLLSEDPADPSQSNLQQADLLEMEAPPEAPTEPLPQPSPYETSEIFPDATSNIEIDVPCPPPHPFPSPPSPPTPEDFMTIPSHREDAEEEKKITHETHPSLYMSKSKKHYEDLSAYIDCCQIDENVIFPKPSLLLNAIIICLEDENKIIKRQMLDALMAVMDMRETTLLNREEKVI